LKFALKESGKLDRLRKRGKRILRPVRPSRKDEAGYHNQLKALVKRVIQKTEEALLPYLKANESLIMLNATDAMTDDEIRRRLAEVRRNSRVDKKSAESISTNAATHVLETVDERLKNEIRRSVGINIGSTMLDNSQINPALANAVKENINLITSIPEQYMDRVEKSIVEAVVKGKRHEELAEIFYELGQSTFRRAQLIARDQITKMFSDFNRIRQTSVGIEEYVWSTAKDERVRETHAENEGKTFRWDNPDEETGHPGTEINCRCIALPLIDLEEKAE
jgi:SPP1 gp7 family putative phage head morphogenesis protein